MGAATVAAMKQTKDSFHLRVVVHDGADGYFVAECLDLPGCMSQGKTKEEALSNIGDALRGQLYYMMVEFQQSGQV